MAFYTNQTRHNAILTIRIDTTGDPQKSLQKGTNDVLGTINADVGYHDLLVEPGLELSLGENTTATLISVRGDG